MNRSPWTDITIWITPTLLAFFVALALVIPTLLEGDPNSIEMGRKLLPPGTGGILGNDQLGRDVALRVLYGGRVALSVGLLAVVCSISLAAFVGLVAGYVGGKVDLLLVSVVDLLLTLPGLLITLALLGILGTGRLSMVAALVGASWASEARILRSRALSIRSSGYVESSLAMGARHSWVLLKHIFPNALSTLLVLASLNLGEVLLVVSGLSFLGLGTQPPDADWGTMLADSRPFLGQAPWLMLAPGLCIVFYSLLCHLVGDSLRAALDRSSSW